MTDYSLLNIATFVVIVAIFSQLAQDKLKLPASISALSVGLLLKMLSGERPPSLRWPWEWQ